MRRVLTILFLLLLNPVFASDLDKKIGQMIITGFNGDTIKAPDFKKTLKQLKNGEISGVILFGKNIKTKEDLISMNEKMLSSNKITPFVAIDNEGGLIQRHKFFDNKSAFQVAKLKNIDAHKEYENMAKNLKEIKINFDFAPCVDLAINKASIIVKKERSFSFDPDVVINYSKIFIDELSKQKIITSIKHFPGHGSVKGDTHLGFVDATDVFSEDEIKPYKELASHNELNTVMVSHIFNKNFDENYPASLSKKTIDYLKNNIGFKGVIVSDDFDMGAIRKNYSLDEIIVNSINSGVDLLMFSNNLDNYDINIAKKIRKIVKREIKKGTIKLEDIENSYQKIVELKEKLLE